MPIVQDKADIGQPLVQSLDDGQYTIVPSDTVDTPVPIMSVYVGGTGDLTYLTPDRRSITLKALPVGARPEIDAVRIMATGTSATLLVGFTFKNDR